MTHASGKANDSGRSQSASDQRTQIRVFIHRDLATRSLILLILLLLFAACAADKMQMRLYPGPERSGEEIARLLVSESLEVQSINGEPIPRVSRIVRSGERGFDLLPGGYEVVLYYDEILAKSAAEDEVVQSELQLARLEIEAGQVVRLETRQVVDLDDARRLASDLRVTLVDVGSGKPIRQVIEVQPAVVSKPVVVRPILPNAKPGMESSASPSSPAPVVERVASREEPVTAEEQAPGEAQRRVPTIAPAPAPAPVAGASPAVHTLHLLKFWWERASSEERAAFRGWIDP